MPLVWLISLLFVFCASPLGSAAAEAPEPNAIYISPEGVLFVSYSKQWDADKLETLDTTVFQKLPKGQELGKLERIVLKEDGPADYDGMFFHTLFRNKKTSSMRDEQWIELYHVQEHNTPESLAYTLSHEYGHLFTMYWLMHKEQRTVNDPNSGWARIRNLKGYPISWKKPGRDKTEYFWDPAEIMADDYAMLFGPLEAKSDMLQDKGRTYSLDLRPNNQLVPAAESVGGLRAYWSKLSGVKLDAPPLPSLRITGLAAKPGTDEFGNDAIVYEPTLQGTLVKDKGYQYTVVVTNQSELHGEYTFDASLYQDGSSSIAYTSADMKGTWGVRLFVVDPKSGRINYSTLAWFNFDDPQNPKPTENPMQIVKPITEQLSIVNMAVNIINEIILRLEEYLKVLLV